MIKNPVWVVKEVKPQDDFTMIITFASGEKPVYDAHELLKKNIYNKLNNIAFFLQAKVDCGTVVWNDDIDIAPEHIYENSELVIEKDDILSADDEQDILQARVDLKNGDCVRHENVNWK